MCRIERNLTSRDIATLAGAFASSVHMFLTGFIPELAASSKPKWTPASFDCPSRLAVFLMDPQAVVGIGHLFFAGNRGTYAQNQVLDAATLSASNFTGDGRRRLQSRH